MESDGLALVVPNGCRKCNVTVLEAALVASDSSNIRPRRRALREVKPRVRRSIKSPDVSVRSRSRYDDRRCRDKSRQYMERLLARDMDVRYMTNLKSYIDKIKSIYNCEPKGCPALKERLHNHRSEHHSDNYHSDEQNLGRECSSLQHRLDGHFSHHHQEGICSDTKGNTAQTKITLSNLGTLTISIETGSSDAFAERQAITDGSEENDMEAIEGGYFNENSETPAELAHRYGMNVEEQVKNWIKNIPFRPNEVEADVLRRENTVNTLINSIEGLASQMRATNYSDKIKNLIENAVSKLDVFYPGSKRDQAAFKEGLRENMIQRLKEMNDKFLAGQDRIIEVNSDGTYIVDDYGLRQNRRSIANDEAGGKRLSFAPHKYVTDSGTNGLNLTSVPDKIGEVVYAGDGKSSFISNTTADTNFATGTQSFSANSANDAANSGIPKPPDINDGSGQSPRVDQRQSIAPGDLRLGGTSSGQRRSVTPGGPRQSNVQGEARQSYAQGGPRQSNAQGGPRQSVSPGEPRQSIVPGRKRPSLSPGQSQNVTSNIPRLSKAQNDGSDQNYVSGPRQSYAPGVPRQSLAADRPRQSIAPGSPLPIVEQNQTTNQNIGREQRQNIAPNSGRQNIASERAKPSISPGGPTQKVSPIRTNGKNYRDGPRQSYALGGPRQSMASGQVRQSISPTGPNPVNQNYGGGPRQSYAQERQRQSYVSGGLRQSMTPNVGRQSMTPGGGRQSISPNSLTQNIAPNQNAYTFGIPNQNYAPNAPGGQRKSMSPGGPRQSYAQNKMDSQGRTATNNGPNPNFYKTGNQNRNTRGRQNPYISAGEDQTLGQSNSPTAQRQSTVDHIYGGGLRQNYAKEQKQIILPNGTRSTIASNNIAEQNYVNNGNRTSYVPGPRQSITPGTARHSIVTGVQRPSTAPAGLNQNFTTNTASGTSYETDSTSTNYGIVGTKLNVAPNKILDISFEPLGTGESQSSSPSGTNTNMTDGTTTTNTGYEYNQPPNENIKYNPNTRPNSSPAGYGLVGSTLIGRPTNKNIETSKSYVINNNDPKVLPYGPSEDSGKIYVPNQNINGNFQPGWTTNNSNGFGEKAGNLFETNVVKDNDIYDSNNASSDNYDPNINKIDAFEETSNAENVFTKPNYMPNADDNERCFDICDYGEKARKTKKRYSISGICSGLENITKCTIPSGDLCSCLDDKQRPKKKIICCGPKKLDMEKEIADWLKRTSILKETGINKKEIVDALLIQLGPFLAKPSDQINKTILKAKVTEILKSLGICPSNMGNMKSHIYKFADDLSNRLIGIISRLECSGGGSWKCDVMANRPFNKLEQVNVGPNEVLKADLKYDLLQEIKECLLNTRLAHNRFVEENIADLLIARIELIRTGMEDVAREDIKFVLHRTDELSDSETEIITNCIMNAAKEIITLINNIDNRTGYATMIAESSCLSGTLSIYTSEHEITPIFNTTTPEPIGSSTPKKKLEVERFSPEEKAFTNKVATIIGEWMNNMPNPFTVETDRNMLELMINDLTGEIVDHVKVMQLAPDPNCDNKSFITYYIYKWLLKFEILEDLSDAEPYTQTLVTQLLQLNVPDLTRSQYGTRQSTKKFQYLQTEEAWTEPYVPKAQDILEDEISIWMNQQPSDIYVNNDKSVQNQMVHEIAEKLQVKLAADKENENVSKEIKEWMEKVIKPNERNRVDSLSNSLLERIKKLPQDTTIKAKIQERIRAKTAVAPPISANSVSQTTEYDDYENTIKNFVLKYIEHNYDTHDSLAKGAYIQLLKSELRRFSPLSRNELYNKAEAGATGDAFTSGNLNRELEFVKDVSDWLKNIPIKSSYNTVGNKERIELVIGLAKNIVEVEEEVRRTPQAMDYTAYLAGIILQFLDQLPILPDQKNNAQLMIEQLLTKIITKVNQAPRPMQQTGLSVAEIIEEYIRVNGQEIADDELKLEVWTARLLKEIKKMIAETNLENVSPEDIQNKLAIVALPGDESVRRFNLELDYAKEIADWVKNFAVTRPIDVVMVYDLAKKIADHESDLSVIQTNDQVDQELNDYIKHWILLLPLDSSKEIDMPFVIQQLKNRIDKVKCKESITLPSFESSKSKNRRKSFKQGCATCLATEDPGAVVVKVVEDWCKSLPLEGGNKDEIKKVKDDVANKLYQKIGELNDDPRYIHSEAVYEQEISDEVDKQLNSLPANLKLKGKKEEIKLKLVDSLLAAKTQVENITAGIHYKKRLEGIIETSMPNPLQIEFDDPGFEVYKTNLASIFLLDNFDHSNDAIKLKYENKIKNEIEKYSPNALHRNAIPMTKEQLYNELYSSMYKVQLPEQCPLGDEVRVIKTKCEINDWFETLPIKAPTEASQILEYCSKQDILAKKIQFLEKEKKSSEKIFNEIVKWLNKIPALAGDKNNINKFASNLQERLKHTQNDRKCFRPWDVKSRESKIMFKFGETSKSSKDKKRTSSEVKHWISPNTNIEQIHYECKQKSGDVLIDIAEKWCKNLPMPPNIPEEQQRSLKDDFATKILIKISELNSDPQTFNENQMYDYLLNEELEKLLGMLPQSDLLFQSKEAMKSQLISAVNSVKPLVREEKSRFNYIKDLEDSINIFIEVPEHTTSIKAALHTDVKEKVIDNFVEYQYNRDDEEGKQYYKNRMLETLAKYNYKISPEKDVGKSRGEALMLGNQLICELSKIPLPNVQALKDEVQEIRMKQEVDDFLSNISPLRTHEDKNVIRNQLKNSLAKQLIHVEKKGHTRENDERMKNLISKTMKKLSFETSDQKISGFIKKLKETEKLRKVPPIRRGFNGNFSLPVYMHEGNYPAHNIGPMSQSLPVGMPSAFDPNVNKHLIRSPTPIQPIAASTSYQVQPTPSNQIQPAIPSNQIQATMISNQIQPAVPSNQIQATMTSNQIQPTTPSNRIQSTMTSNHIQPAIASTQTQSSAPHQGVGPDPVSLSKALKPLIMSFPTEDAIQTWNRSESGAVPAQLEVDVHVHRPNALQYVPNTGTYIPRTQQTGQYVVPPNKPPSSLDERHLRPVSVGIQGSRYLPPPISETGVQISGPLPLIVPISEAGVQYETTPTGSTRIGKPSQTSGVPGPFVDEQAEDPDVPEECYCDIYPYLPHCGNGNLGMPLLNICESCGDISPMPFFY